MTQFVSLSLLVTFLFLSEAAFGRNSRWREEKRGCTCSLFSTCKPCINSGKRNFRDKRNYDERESVRPKEESRLISDAELNYLSTLIGEYLQVRDTDESYRLEQES